MKNSRAWRDADPFHYRLITLREPLRSLFIPPRSAQHSRPLTLPASSSGCRPYSKTGAETDVPASAQHRFPQRANRRQQQTHADKPNGLASNGQNKGRKRGDAIQNNFNVDELLAPDSPKKPTRFYTPASLSPVCFWQSAGPATGCTPRQSIPIPGVKRESSFNQRKG